MKKELTKSINTKWAGKNIVWFDRTDSTNTQARRLAEEGAPHGTLVLADMQDGGKGRLGRTWMSPAGDGIWMSILLRPEISPMSASMLTLVAALAAEKGIRGATGQESRIKWPNDLVLNRKKICGILTEMSTEQMEIKYVIIGIGINVGQNAFPEELKQSGTSLYLETGKKFNRAEITARIMEALEMYYEIFVETKDMSGLLKEYNEKLVNLGQEVRVLAASGDFGGVACGINESGSLIVQLPDGNKTEVISGEVSVRGVYGYV